MIKINKMILSAVVMTVVASVVLARADDTDLDAIHRGNDAYGRGQYEAAIMEYRQVSRLGDHYAEAEYNIGVCYFEMNLLPEAVAHYAVAIKVRDGRYVNALYALAVAYEALGRSAEAKDAYTRASDLSNGRHVGAIFKLGFINQREGKHRIAEVLYRRALTRSSGRFPACHNNLGVVLALEGRYGEAEDEFAAALRDSKGKFADARRNMELCRQLIATRSRDLVAQLISSETGIETIDKDHRRQ